MNYIVEFTCVTTVLWFVLHYVMHVNLTRRFILVPIATFTASIFSILIRDEFAYLFFALILYFLFPVICTSNIKKRVVLYTSALTVTLTYFLFGFIYFIMDTFEFPHEAEAYVLTLIIAILGVIKITNKKDVVNIAKLLSTRTKVVLLIFLMLLFCFFTIINDYLTYQPADVVMIYSFFLYLTVIGSGILIIMLIKNITKKSYYENITKIMDARLTEQVKYYEQVQKTNNDLRTFRHNYKNMKIGLMSLLEKNDIDGAKKYMAECDDIIHIDNTLYQTGNSIVDAILYDKAMRVKDKGIEINFNGIIPTTEITNTDICIIFGNVLDNAIEAVSQLEGNVPKKIDIFVKKNKDYLFIDVINPTKTEVAIKDNQVVTSKKDKDNHGLGFNSIKEALSKYDGHLNIECLNHIFKTSFDFCIG